MKISQVLESQQLDELDMTNAGTATGGVVGKTANALGAVAGGVKGAWDAAKAGFQSGKNFVGGQRVGSTDPKAINQQGPAGTAPAQAVQGSAGTAMGNMGKAMSGQKPAQAGQTLYATVKSQINNIDPQSKQKLLNLVQKSVQQKPKQGGGVSGAIGQMTNALTGNGQPNTMANAPVSATNTASPDNPNLQQQNTAAKPDVAGGMSKAGQDAANAQADANATPTPNVQQQNTAAKPDVAGGMSKAGQDAANAQADANATPTPNVQQQKQAGDQRDPKATAAATKARLQNQRNAGTSMAKTGGNTFSNWVAGSPNYKGFDPQGNPIPNKVMRENYLFKSKFLGGWI
jgi:hypothetical protein